MIRVAVCDDEVHILKELSQQIEAAFQKRSLQVFLRSFNQAEELLREWDTEAFDVLFLDIEMPNMDGVEFGHYLRDRKLHPCIVYVSNLENRVYETFSIAPLRFIRKSHFLDEIDDAVSAIFEWWKAQQQKKLIITERNKIISLAIDSILYIESCAKMQNIVTVSETYRVKNPISEFEEKLIKNRFFRPHKGFLVNYQYIERVESDRLLLQNGTEIPISRRKATETKQIYMRLTTQALKLDALK